MPVRDGRQVGEGHGFRRRTRVDYRSAAVGDYSGLPAIIQADGRLPAFSDVVERTSINALAPNLEPNDALAPVLPLPMSLSTVREVDPDCSTHQTK